MTTKIYPKEQQLKLRIALPLSTVERLRKQFAAPDESMTKLAERILNQVTSAR